MNSNLTSRSPDQSRTRDAASAARSEHGNVPTPGNEGKVRPPLVDAFAYMILDACPMSNLGRTLLYKLTKDGRLRLLKAGGRTLVTGDSLLAADSPKVVQQFLPHSVLGTGNGVRADARNARAALS